MKVKNKAYSNIIYSFNNPVKQGILGVWKWFIWILGAQEDPIWILLSHRAEKGYELLVNVCHLKQRFSTDGSWNFFPKMQKTLLMALEKNIVTKKLKSPQIGIFWTL